MLIKKETISGWGLYPAIEANLTYPKTINDVVSLSKEKCIARGLGRSYGDSSLNKNLTIVTTNLNKVIYFDKVNGVLKAETGTSIIKILNVIIKHGWFLPVTPGTKNVTIGGMVASDVHGKNHHIEGSFGNHLISLEIAINGEIITCSTSDKPDLFWKTIGGMGLTGIIVAATFSLKKINSAFINQKVILAKNIDEAIDLLHTNLDVTYSVTWVDCLAKGSNFGRSIVTLGEHVPEKDGSLETTFFREKSPISIPFFLPSFFLSSSILRIFNFFYNLKAKILPKEKKVSINSFFYPLDSVGHWNRIYGKKGFFQYQAVFPIETSEPALKLILEEIVKSQEFSFLAILKLFGKGNPNLSFPLEGFTLALDFPHNKKSKDLVKKFDAILERFNGKIYLTKDSMTSKKTLLATQEKNVLEFKNFRDQNGMGHFSSVQSERLEL